MTFHKTEHSTRLCVCRVSKDNKIGFDAFDNIYKIVIDDYGNIVFIDNIYRILIDDYGNRVFIKP